MGGDARPPASAGQRDDELAKLVEEHAPAAFRVAYAIVRDKALAEDVVQESIIKAWTKFDSFRGEGSLRSWILTITHNTAVSMLRRVRDVAVDPAEMPETAARVDTERRAEGRVALAALGEALDRLDPLSRAVVVLRELEGLAYEDIAETLEVPVSTVKTRLFRARRSLAGAMEGWT